ncbi:carbon-nitrogen hydrolase family protein [Agrobacterium rhizogenes]|uniref:carbon-nitrogen hydrolase family protein n=1 Tax=Rhizobium TaxID=379 RepID=UPI00026ECA15|nr:MULTISPECIES: carbon-nitrogen hydrolase family protein [Rhizobium]OCJ24952.1 acyltransferase [Agrobacterium sp. B131/95]OCJ31896.1 acyltransferase [Agrobacterium sp. B133/95]EJK80445.1 putative amidohydrolase [Rhizobium sp. AP16]MDJ1633018.1 carbon-nitrogen hydrolase family protein [Rhizobium rhizogenes]NTG06531.1 carbon-nitrogen hydrolase family protein [Rhizobium rhizogenes]
MRIAAFQRLALFDAVDKVGDVLARDLAWADAQGIDLALFPECYLQGHSYNEAIARRRALSLDDPTLNALIGRCVSGRTTAIIGLFERRGEAIYNSAVVAKAGRIVGVYAKAHPLESGCTPGTDFPIWALADWRFGINICADLRYPYTASRLARKGAGLICNPVNLMLRPHKAEMWHKPGISGLQVCARHTGCWVMASDVVGSNKDGWLSYGSSAIVDPNGVVVAKAKPYSEDVLVFDLPDRHHERGFGRKASMIAT